VTVTEVSVCGSPVLCALEQALALLPPDRTTRTHAVVLAALARSLMHVGDMRTAEDTARRAVAAARTAGAKDVEADAVSTVGGASTYLHPARLAWTPCGKACGWRSASAPCSPP
jgi:5-enolpyruvylshikimate-3-phosphate synthase